MSSRARLFVISGPSGAGKGTLIKKLLSEVPELALTVSATTREPRPGEVDGEAYYFLDEATFKQKVADQEFLEWANVHGHFYGTLKSEVKRKLSEGHSVLLEIDQQGAHQIKALMPDAVLVFIKPPSLEELEKRLRARATEDEESIQLRLKNAKTELSVAKDYDIQLINDKLEDALAELKADILAFEQKEL